MKYKLMEHQLYALDALEANEGLMIAYEAGCGKTAIALTYIYRHLKRGDIRDALVVCPASLVPSWEQAIDEMVNFEGFDSHAVQMLKDNVTIRSFQKMYRVKKIPIRRTDGKLVMKRELHVRDDLAKHWSVFVVDEAHQCSAHDAVQTKIAITLSTLSDRVISMSGTYLHGGGGKPAYYKLYGEIQVVTKGKAFKNWTEFSNKAVTAVDKWYKPMSYNETYCKKLMDDHCIACRLVDCVDMPEKVDQMVKCSLAEKAVYKDLATGDIMKYGLSIENAGGQYTKMLQVCSGSMKIDDTSTMTFDTSKDNALSDILKGTDGPVVVFCTYRASVNRAYAIAKKAGRKTVMFDGRSKKETWKDFQSGKADCIVCQYQSGGVGLNLQVASHMVLFEPCYSSLLLTQAKGRIFRANQRNRCVYYFLYTPNTIEKRVWDMVKTGKDLTDAVMRQWDVMGIQ